MRRLERAFLILVAAPALTFAVGGIYVVGRSRTALGPELDRHAAARAGELVRQERLRLQRQLTAWHSRLADLTAQLVIERFTVYDSVGQVGTLPLDSAPVPLRILPDRSEAMLASAQRGNTVAELARVEGRTVWLAYINLADRLAVALARVDPQLASRFQEQTGYQLALYLDDERIPPAEGDWPNEIPSSISDSLSVYDRPLSTRLADRQIAVAPIKDFDEWDIIGAAAVKRSLPQRPLPKLPKLPAFVLLVALGVTVVAVSRMSQQLILRAGELRRRFALALLPPALAATWLAFSDARASAWATDEALRLSGGVVNLVDEVAMLPADQLNALTGATSTVMRGDTIAGGSEAVPAEKLAGLTEMHGRLSLGGRRFAYRKIDIDAETRLLLLQAPLEDARKNTLFVLAGLYALLAVGILIFASLAFAGGSSMELREAVTAWSFLTPSLVLLLLFSAGPLLFAFYLSFHEWNLLEPAKPFVGLRHYIDLGGDGLFWNAAKNTAIYSLYVPLTMVLALAVAMLLNRQIKGVAVLRAVFFLPYITSFVAISIVWQWMYDPDFGLFNWALGLVGLGPYPWLNSPATALLALIIMAVWIHIGFQMIIFLAGLQAIPNELYEAAMIDGAGPWSRFWRITLPLLRPTTFFVLVTSIIGSFQVFTFVYVMTEGGPLHATDVIVYHIYQNAWQYLRMGYASAMSWLLFAVIFAITLLQFRLLGRRMEAA